MKRNSKKTLAGRSTKASAAKRVDITWSDVLQKGSYEVGDGLEKVGQMLEQRGFSKVGTLVKNFGNKVEHWAD